MKKLLDPKQTNLMKTLFVLIWIVLFGNYMFVAGMLSVQYGNSTYVAIAEISGLLLVFFCGRLSERYKKLNPF